MTETTLIAGCDVWTPLGVFEGGSLLIRGAKLARVGSVRPADVPRGTKRLSFPGCRAVPGFIDIHTHGGDGADFIDGSAESAALALRAHLRSGTTAILPTLITASKEQTIKALRALNEAKKRYDDIPEVLGVNLEGPYLSKEKRGVHDEGSIRPASAAELREFWEASDGSVRLVTLAPENPGFVAALRFLRRKGVVVAVGHTNALSKPIAAAVGRGARHATHLFNAMRGVFHREPGAAGALLLDDRVSTEVISDGQHLHPEIVKMISRVKPASKVILITDAVKEFGRSKGAALRTADGTLAGSLTPLPRMLKNYLNYTGVSFADGLRAATLNPAALFGLEGRIGCLQRGADADIVMLDKNFKVRGVFLKGRLVHGGASA
jgi:N-acetylglucosamine-6-phosphate deacetylase